MIGWGRVAAWIGLVSRERCAAAAWAGLARYRCRRPAGHAGAHAAEGHYWGPP